MLLVSGYLEASRGIIEASFLNCALVVRLLKLNRQRLKSESKCKPMLTIMELLPPLPPDLSLPFTLTSTAFRKEAFPLLQLTSSALP